MSDDAEYFVRSGALTPTDAFNAVCDDLAKAQQEIEDLRASLAAHAAAAWRAGRDAAAAKCDAANDEWLTLSKTYERCHAYAAGAASIAVQISKLVPPADLAAALAAHTERAVQAEREAIAAWLDSRREVYEARAIEAVEGDDQTDMMAAACYETASNFVRARGTP